MDIWNSLKFVYAFAEKHVLLEWIYYTLIVAMLYYAFKFAHHFLRRRFLQSFLQEKQHQEKLLQETPAQENPQRENQHMLFSLWRDLSTATLQLFLAGSALYIGTRFVVLPIHIEELIQKIAMIIFWLQVALWLSVGLKFGSDRYLQQKRIVDHSAITTAALILFCTRVLAIVLVTLLALDNIGFDVTTLIASLGIGGIAIALAVQNILGDLLASLSITLDKPFVVGDFIVMESFMGTVENIGLKTTRLRSLSGEQIIFSNAELLKGRIRNYKRMYERRVQFTFTLQYLDNSPAILRDIADQVGKFIGGLALTRFDRCHFARFSELGLEFETVYMVLDADFNKYMDIQQKINLRLLEIAKTANANFAFTALTGTLGSASD